MSNNRIGAMMKNDVRGARLPKLRLPQFEGAGPWTIELGGKVFDQIKNKDHNSDLPVLAVTQEHGAIPRDLINYHVSVADASIEGYKVVEVGDFIISLRSFQGGIEFSNYRGICSPAYVILRLKHGYSKEYFRHYLKTERFIGQLTKNLEGLRDGKMISYKQFSELHLIIPSYTEQQRIADSLSTIDKLIAEEKHKLDALKEHKAGLMQELFPREGEAVPRSRFPKYKSEPIWQWRPFCEVVLRSFYGTSESTSESGKYPVLRMGNMIDGAIDTNNLTFIDMCDSDFEKFKLNDGDILLNRTNSADLVGKISLFSLAGNYVAASYIVAFRLKPKLIHSRYCNYLLNSEHYQRMIRSFATRAISQANINPSTFQERLRIPIPSLSEQGTIADCFSSLDESIIAQSRKVEALKSQKNGLMQRLFPTLDDVYT